MIPFLASGSVVTDVVASVNTSMNDSFGRLETGFMSKIKSEVCVEVSKLGVEVRTELANLEARINTQLDRSLYSQNFQISTLYQQGILRRLSKK